MVGHYGNFLAPIAPLVVKAGAITALSAIVDIISIGSIIVKSCLGIKILLIIIGMWHRAAAIFNFRLK